MAVTKIANVIVPELFIPYVIKRTAELSTLINSGIVTANPRLDELITGGGTTIQMPHWNDLSGNSEVLSEASPLTAQNITASKEVAPVLYRGKAWGATELSGCLAGSDPMKAIGDLVAEWWNRDEQTTLINVLNGMFAASNMSALVSDITSATNPTISASAVLDAKQLLGDAANKLTALAVHSATYTKLQKDNVIQFVAASESKVQIPTYLGYKVIINDNLPYTPATTGQNATPATYASYLFAEGAIGRGEGTPVSLTPVETDRDSLASTDYLIHRRALVLHPQGMAWTPASTLTGATPTNSELATGANWTKVADTKQFGIVKLVHTL